MNQKHKGAILLLTTILLFVLLGMVVSLSYVTVMEQKMSQKTKSSVGSFYNSESGIEWALNKIANSSGTIISAFSTFSGGKAPCPSGFSCDIFLLDTDGKVITNSNADLSLVKAVRSVGSQGGETQRAIEAAVASGGGGCYVSYKNDPTDAACVAGFKNKGSAGGYGYCHDCGSYSSYSFLRPPNGVCSSGWCYDGDIGQAYVCCM